MNLIQCIAMSIVVATVVFPALAEPLPGATAAPLKSEPETVFSGLTGRWVRPDGGYVIAIKSVDASGKLDANYANPNPLPFYAATATEEGGKVKLFFELRAGGYNGSTYTLIYDFNGDQLKGQYYQAVAKQTFEVVFFRKSTKRRFLSPSDLPRKHGGVG
jgi:hypothetical protein